MAIAAPPIVHDPIPFGSWRIAETRAYAVRHYGLHRARLIAPKVIVEHMTENASFSETFNTFAPDVPDSELHELPGTCAHFVIDTNGTIHQLVSLKWICRHTVGLNWTAIGIEHVGFREAGVLGSIRMLRASLRLTRWLQAKYGITDNNVIGHAESLSSRYHRENVVRLKTQTHGDWPHRFMVTYRRDLAAE
ncbi:peptidoglycan recognition family protein [Baekduia sp.]|jgi:beta-N-acetylhexosaminidase|uniref:peptidoglycan recognition family protein n=1 Tax=Baekduia sp. TaxID=2600305 RepID=UPI002E05CE48|nr:peptidoglycan recognition family protein [Baekduia sp.]